MSSLMMSQKLQRLVITIAQIHNVESNNHTHFGRNDFPGLKLLYFNSNLILGKLDLIKTNVAIYEPEIVCIAETKVDKIFDDNELFGPDFVVARNDRKQGGGGVMIAIKNNCRHLLLLKSADGPGESVIMTLCVHIYTVNL